MSKLLNEVRNTLRVHHYAIKTEKAYVQWIKRYIFFHNMTHPLEMGKNELEEFLPWLAVKRKVAPSTQNSATGSGLVICVGLIGGDSPIVFSSIRGCPDSERVK